MDRLNRIIKPTARTSSIQIQDCLSSLFILELLSPINELYLFSPWISDVVVLDNRHGQFRALLPELITTEIRLSYFLNMLAERGEKIHILCRPDTHNDNFLGRLDLPMKYLVKQVESIHEKMMVNEHFYLRGSMNFTYQGLHLSDENTELTCDPEEVNRNLIEARNRWGQL
jgi:hypothetical protein